MIESTIIIRIKYFIISIQKRYWNNPKDKIITSFYNLSIYLIQSCFWLEGMIKYISDQFLFIR